MIKNAELWIWFIDTGILLYALYFAYCKAAWAYHNSKATTYWIHYENLLDRQIWYSKDLKKILKESSNDAILDYSNELCISDIYKNAPGTKFITKIFNNIANAGNINNELRYNNSRRRS